MWGEVAETKGTRWKGKGNVEGDDMRAVGCGKGLKRGRGKVPARRLRNRNIGVNSILNAGRRCYGRGRHAGGKVAGDKGLRGGEEGGRGKVPAQGLADRYRGSWVCWFRGSARYRVEFVVKG
jgi:hypothetical protein